MPNTQDNKDAPWRVLVGFWLLVPGCLAPYAVWQG